MDSTSWEIDRVLPLPYRILFLLTLGTWFWHWAVCIFHRTRIDVLVVLGFNPNVSANVDLRRATRLVAVQTTVMGGLAYLVYVFARAKTSLALSLVDWVPLVTLGAMTYGLLFHTSTTGFGKRRLRATAARMLAFGINPSIRNNEILLSDAFTSYAKVLLDLLVYVAHLVSGTTCFPVNGTVSLDRTYGAWFGLDTLIVAYPTAVRLVQCLKEYRATANGNHLLNALKYATGFLPLLVGLALKNAPEASTAFYLKLWFVVSMINSSYTFFWDVTHDWNFGFFQNWLAANRSRGLLRPVLHYGDRQIYFTAIAVDFALRFIWTTRLLPNGQSATYVVLTSLYSSEHGVFILELLELTRRFVWMIVRVETEWVKLEATVLAKEDVALSDRGSH